MWAEDLGFRVSACWAHSQAHSQVLWRSCRTAGMPAGDQNLSCKALNPRTHLLLELRVACSHHDELLGGGSIRPSKHGAAEVACMHATMSRLRSKPRV